MPAGNCANVHAKVSIWHKLTFIGLGFSFAFAVVDSKRTQGFSLNHHRPNTLIYLPPSLTVDIPTPSSLHAMPSPASESEVSSAELTHPQFPVGTSPQINDDWVSLETEEHAAESSNVGGSLAKLGNGTWRFSSLGWNEMHH